MEFVDTQKIRINAYVKEAYGYDYNLIKAPEKEPLRFASTVFADYSDSHSYSRRTRIGQMDTHLVLPDLIDSDDKASELCAHAKYVSKELSDFFEAVDYIHHESNYGSFGFTYPYEPFAYVNYLYVAPEFRRLGIARRMIYVMCKHIWDNTGLNINLLILRDKLIMPSRADFDGIMSEEDLTAILSKMCVLPFSDTSDAVANHKHYFYYRMGS